MNDVEKFLEDVGDDPICNCNEHRLLRLCRRYREQIKEYAEAEHYEYCGEVFSETDEVKYNCGGLKEHIAKALEYTGLEDAPDGRVG